MRLYQKVDTISVYSLADEEGFRLHDYRGLQFTFDTSSLKYIVRRKRLFEISG